MHTLKTLRITAPMLCCLINLVFFAMLMAIKTIAITSAGNAGKYVETNFAKHQDLSVHTHFADIFRPLDIMF